MASLCVVLVAFIAYGITKASEMFDKNISGGSPFFSSSKAALKGEGDGRINILVAGMGGANHPGGFLTDSMMVISIDPTNKTMAMLSIPRDLYVPIADHKISAKINEAYSIGEKEKKGTGADLMKKTVGNILDLPIHYYVTVDFQGFEKIIDILGGIDVYVDKAIYDPLYPADDMINYSIFSIKAGQQHLDGKTALKYARSRETTSDFDRAARQQKVISAIRAKALKLGFLANPKKIIDVLATISSNVKTDLAPSEIKSLMDIMKDISSDKTISKVLSDDPSGPLVSDTSSGTFYLKPRSGNFNEIKQIAHEIFTDPNLSQENAKIQVLNGTTQTNLTADLATDLKSYGYQVASQGAAGAIYKNTVIYDYSGGKKATTLQFLKKRLGAQIISKTSKNADVDIAIIIGSDYNGFIKQTN